MVILLGKTKQNERRTAQTVRPIISHSAGENQSKQSIKILHDGITVLADHHHHVVAVGNHAGLLAPDAGGLGIPSAAVDHGINAGLEDGLHSGHVLAVLHLDQGNLAHVHGHHIDVYLALLGSHAAQAGVVVVQHGGISQAQVGHGVLRGDRAVASRQIHLAGLGIRGGGTAAAGAGTAAGAGAAAGGGLALFPLAGNHAGSSLVTGSDGDLGVAGLDGNHLAVLIYGSHVGVAGLEGHLGALGHAVHLQGVAGTGGEEGKAGAAQGQLGLLLSLALGAVGGAGAARGGSAHVRAGAGGVRGAHVGAGRRLAALAGGDTAVIRALAAVGAIAGAAAGQQRDGEGRGKKQSISAVFHSRLLLFSSLYFSGIFCFQWVGRSLEKKVPNFLKKFFARP